MSFPPSAGGQPTSFKTNVNRAKTKRWVEAKSYSYDGDDWGEMDEYDEYGDYDEPAPPPRPTGLRQRGQSASQEPQGAFNLQQESYGGPPDNRKRGYGDMGPQVPVQPYGIRSVTNPAYNDPELNRSNSFDRGDERRAFSAGPVHPGTVSPQPGSRIAPSYPQNQSAADQKIMGSVQPQYDHQNTPPHPASQPQSRTSIEGQRRTVEQATVPLGNYRGVSYSEQQRQPSMGSRTQSMTSNTSLDFHNRRDFSPSAMPPPLQTRGSPSPQSVPNSQSSGWHPPRKSSLSQQNPSDPPYSNQPPSMSSPRDAVDGGAVTRERTESNTSKPLPFVRPADIYKRMQEERQRERQSQDSSRPSMDAIVGNEGLISPVRAKDDPGMDQSVTSENARMVGDSKSLQHNSGPDAEPKSEYGLTDVPAINAGPKGDHFVPDATLPSAIRSGETPSNIGGLSPMLPDVARMSGFGELFGATSQNVEEPAQSHTTAAGSSSQTTEAHAMREGPDSTLQHQPSLGFRSVVHQAFDTPHDQVPATPGSSTADSSIGRSGSGGTSVVSPIISRGPSTAASNTFFREAQDRSQTPAIVDEGRPGDTRPTSSSSLGTPKQIARKPSPSQEMANQRPTSFIPGHRRDLSTPSTDNSPARTPAVEENKQLCQPQEAEIAMATPTDPRFPPAVGGIGAQPTDQVLQAERPSIPGINKPWKPRDEASPVDRTGSPNLNSGEVLRNPVDTGRGKVRNLADRFESGRNSPAGSETASSPSKRTFTQDQTYAPPRPLADRMESFRPKLPGGWESSASLTPSRSSNRSEVDLVTGGQDETHIKLPKDQLTPTPTKQASNQQSFGLVDASKPLQSGPTGLGTDTGASTNDAFSNLAAAGTALAGAFAAAIGTDNRENTSPEYQDRDLDQPASIPTRPRNASVNTAFIPEASKPPMLSPPDDAISSIMPTPLDKLPQSSTAGQSQSSEYFPSDAESKQLPDDPHPRGDTASIKRSQMLPSLSTDPKPQYESDRLRREIIRELSPRLASEPTTAESDSPWQEDSRLSASPNIERQQHESMVLPREYDSYWNGSDSERSSRGGSVRSLSQAEKTPMVHNNKTLSSNTPTQQAHAQSQTVPADLKYGPTDAQIRPNPPAHRFSWEEGIADSPQNHSPDYDKVPLESKFDSIPTSTTNMQDQSAGLELGGTHDNGSMADGLAFMHGSGNVDLGPIPVSGLATHDRTAQGQVEQMHDLEQIPTQTEGHNLVSPTPGQTASLESSQSIDRTSGKPLVSETAYRDEQYDHPRLSNSPARPLNPVSDFPPPPPATVMQPRVQNFREIMAMKNPLDRTRAYNETREQFAEMNTGLAHWLSTTMMELPEHRDVFPYGRLPGISGHKPSPSRTRLGGLLPTGGHPNQQPYYQQYLNASSQPSAIDGGSGLSGKSGQPYSPTASSNKLSSQQMQARGKDLLHSAGVFSGKANVAAKGLFSKGKNRLKGGNADKVDK